MGGVVDFRIEAIRHATLVELDRPDWWAEFCNCRDGVRLSIQREPTDAARFLHWVERCVVPTIESVQECSGQKTLTDVWRALESRFRGVKAGG
ncbi:MAG: replication initiation factor domain-containing protein, partial [Pseudomonadota bacterium]